MANILRSIDRFVDRLLSATAVAAVILMLLLAGFIGTQVVARNIFGFNIRGLFDLSSYSLIIFTFLSAAYTLKNERHICVDLLVSHMPSRARPGFDFGVQLASLVFTFVLGYTAYDWASRSFQRGLVTISDVPIQKGILISSIAVGAVLLSLQIIRTMGRSLKALPAPVAHGEWRLRDNPFVYMTLFLFGIVASLVLSLYGNMLIGLCLLALVLLFSGMPVFLALGFVGGLGLYFLVGKSALNQIPFFAFQAVDSFPLTCLPLFIIAGLILERGKIVEKVFSLFQLFAGRFHSAPLVVTILLGGFFCAISGSSVATTSIIAAVTLPLLTRQGYDKSLSSGVVAGATIGTVIPPSVGYILYGVITNESIGRLFMAGIIPGAIILGLYCIYVILLGLVSRKRLFEGRVVPERVEKTDPLTAKEAFRHAKDAFWGIVAPVFVLGGIYLGFFTPSEAAAVMVVYAVLVTAVFMRTLNGKEFIRCILVGAEVSSMILLIIVGARIFGAVTSQMGVAAHLVTFVNEVGISPMATLGLVCLLLFIFGMFLDSASIMVITLPVIYPLIIAAGFDSVWFGVFFMIILETGLLTPPVGLNIFLIYGISNFPLYRVIKGVIPFVIIMLLALVLFLIYPELITWLPDTMIK